MSSGLRWYTGDPTYDTVLAFALGLVGLVAISAPFVPTPYGRFATPRWGMRFDPRVGWLLMELPSTLSFFFFYLRGPNRFELVPLVFLGVWTIHYANRGFFFPASMRVARGAESTFSLMVVATGWLVTTLHGYLNGSYFSTFGRYSPSWLTDPRFVLGIAIYATSLALNIHSDAILRNLRSREEVARGDKVYRIPKGGIFRWVSSPSYLVELTGWAGFALFTWSPGGLFILAISAANLVPRAIATHRWYLERFPDYPKDRKALVPFVW